MVLIRKIIWLSACLCCVLHGFAQEKKSDTTNILDKINLPVKNKFLNNIFEDGINSLRHDPRDTLDEVKILIVKSEKAFKRYEGKIIRKIMVRRFDFERTFSDTSNRINFIGTKILNALHTDTREWVVRDNLFIHENTPLNAYKLAENERFLRTLEFIQDTRIFVNPVEGNDDSVDIVVITKDLFTLAAVLDASLQSVKLRVAEANFLGAAQRIQVTGLWDQNRHPRMGYEALYSKTNIGGSFINGTVAYSLINGGRSDGTEDESAFLVRLERPLISAFSHVAGGLEVSFNQSQNVYQRPDSIYFDYHYNVYDVWAGYNLTANQAYRSKDYNRRKNLFVALRYLQTDFLNKPVQIGEQYDPIYNNKRGVLGQLSLFKQDFYKLNYLYGFGTTEDIPMGFNLSVTGGWYKQLDLERPYIGFQVEQYLVTPRGGFVDATFKTGGFYHNKVFEDASTLASVNFFTRLFLIKRMKLREYVQISFTQLNHRIIYEPLRLNNGYGLRDFNTDSVNGNRRVSIYAESILYTNKKFLGFRFAPFIYGNFSLMSYEQTAFNKSDIFTGLGGGIRTRNENLVFGTIELRAIYFPNPIRDIQQFHVTLSSDIRFRYRSSFVREPDIVQLNRDDL